MLHGTTTTMNDTNVKNPSEPATKANRDTIPFSAHKNNAPATPAAEPAVDPAHISTEVKPRKHVKPYRLSEDAIAEIRSRNGRDNPETDELWTPDEVAAEFHCSPIYVTKIWSGHARGDIDPLPVPLAAQWRMRLMADLLSGRYNSKQLAKRANKRRELITTTIGWMRKEGWSIITEGQGRSSRFRWVPHDMPVNALPGGGGLPAEAVPEEPGDAPQIPSVPAPRKQIHEKDVNRSQRAQKILDECGHLSGADTAAKHGVSPGAVTRIWNGGRFPHLEPTNLVAAQALARHRGKPIRMGDTVIPVPKDAYVAPVKKTRPVSSPDDAIVVRPGARRGRPKGSKNKPKVVHHPAVVAAQPPVATERRTRTTQLNAADQGATAEAAFSLDDLLKSYCTTT